MQLQRPATVLLAALCLLSAAAAPAAAQSDGEGLAGVFDSADADSSDDGLVARGLSIARDAAPGFVDGILARAQDLAGAGPFSDRPTATEAADDAQTTFNQHASTFEHYGNNRTNATTDADVLKLEFEIDDSDATRYVTADVAGSDYENLSMDDSTDRSVDESCTLEGAAAANAADEIETFHDEFASDGEDVSTSYMGKLASRYGGAGGLGEKVSCSFELAG